MWRSRYAAVLLAVVLTGCTSSGQEEDGGLGTNPSDNQATESLVPGYDGGCEKGFAIWSQNQFTGANGGYGALVRSTLDSVGQSAGLLGNDELTAIGWYKTGELIYPDNPPGIRGEVWYFIPELPNGGSGWVADAGVRAVETDPAPGDRAKFYKPDIQAAPQSPECELSLR